MKIGIDIMGGDYAPQKSVHGAILAFNDLPKNISIVLFGKENEIIFFSSPNKTSVTSFGSSLRARITP